MLERNIRRFAHIDIIDLWIFCLPVLVAGEASSKQRREVVLVGNAYLGSRPPISIIAWLLGSGVLDSLLVCSNCKTLGACNSAQEPATSSKKGGSMKMIAKFGLSPWFCCKVPAQWILARSVRQPKSQPLFGALG